MYYTSVSCLRCLDSLKLNLVVVMMRDMHPLHIPYVLSCVLIYMSSQDCLYICADIHIYCVFATHTHVSCYTYRIILVPILVHITQHSIEFLTWFVVRVISIRCATGTLILYASVSYLRCLDSLRLNLLVDTSMNTMHMLFSVISTVCVPHVTDNIWDIIVCSHVSAHTIHVLLLFAHYIQLQHAYTDMFRHIVNTALVTNTAVSNCAHCLHICV